MGFRIMQADGGRRILKTWVLRQGRIVEQLYQAIVGFFLVKQCKACSIAPRDASLLGTLQSHKFHVLCDSASPTREVSNLGCVRVWSTLYACCCELRADGHTGIGHATSMRSMFDSRGTLYVMYSMASGPMSREIDSSKETPTNRPGGSNLIACSGAVHLLLLFPKGLVVPHGIQALPRNLGR